MIPEQIPSWSPVVSSPMLAQGDLLPDCIIPVHASDQCGEQVQIPTKKSACIVITQSCDLAHTAPELVALCPVFSILDFEKTVPGMTNKRWDEIRKGRREGLYLLPATFVPFNARDANVVDFRQIYSLPFRYLSNHAHAMNLRYRLNSPFLEHLSQGFARFFMRVGLPSTIPEFK